MSNKKLKLKKVLGDRFDFLEEYFKGNLPNTVYIDSIKKRISKNENISSYKLSTDLVKKIDFFYKEIGLKVNNSWHRAYIATNDIEDYRYIPENVFFKTIVPKLNRFDLLYAYTDKNNYDKLFDVKMPNCILRNINGRYYCKNYKALTFIEATDLLDREVKEKIVAKPSIKGGGGKDVQVFALDDIRKIGFKEILIEMDRNYQKDFIIQEFVKQHPTLDDIYPYSLNTLRIITFRYHNEIVVLSKILRMGNSGNNVDNATLGGITCGINSKGQLNKFATEHKIFKKYYKHPHTSFVFENHTIAGCEKAEALVKKSHQELLYFDIVSWDIAIDEEGEAVFIEINLGNQDINFHQRNNGPLFGENTKEMLKYILEK